MLYCSLKNSFVKAIKNAMADMLPMLTTMVAQNNMVVIKISFIFPLQCFAGHFDTASQDYPQSAFCRASGLGQVFMLYIGYLPQRRLQLLDAV
jgi:hypothetical protein